jgi:uncharacterized phage protein gp47/JayE
MATTTQSEFAQQLIAQLRLLNPSVSALVGTPERLILDTVAQALSDSQIDLIGLQNALNIDTKFGSNLDAFLAMFGFARQTSAKASGFVVFSRSSVANVNITIPQGTLLQCNVVTPEGVNVQFTTTSAAILAAGTLQTSPVPIEAVNPGSNGNVAANTITILNTGAPTLGVTAVTNPAATSGGQDQEDDNSLKVRFKNTVFRNLAGTEDQFLALAVSTAFSQKANVVGPISQYQEYVQVPATQDSEAYAYGGGTSYSGTPPFIITTGSTTASSTTLTLPTTAGITATMPVIIFGEGDNPEEVFSGTVNSVLTGTTLKLSANCSKTLNNVVVFIGTQNTAAHVGEWTTALSTIPYAKSIWNANPVFVSNGQFGVENYFYRQEVDFKFNFPALFAGDTLRAYVDGTGFNPKTNALGMTQPNVTLTNIYTGSNNAVQAIAPSQVVLLEYAYTSTSSRNEPAHNVNNAVDVYVDGGNEQPTTTIFTAPLSGSGAAFVDNPTSMYYYENYRRDGEPTKRPLEGNLLTPLYQEPVTSLPSQITIGESNYYLGEHYWLVNDISGYAGTIRARSGIEWSAAVGGDNTSLGVPVNQFVSPPAYKGTFFNALPANTAVEVENYTYDQNIAELQATLEGARQITTDVLAHKAVLRYFKLDVTVVYSPSSSVSMVNNGVRNAVQTYLESQYFGAVIRLSDLLQVIHDVPGIENVRWSNDVPATSSAIRVYETDNNGLPLLQATVDRRQVGTASAKEIQGLYVAGQPKLGQFKLTYGVHSPITVTISTMTATTIETAINGVLGGGTVKVTEDTRSATGVTSPIRSFRIEWQANGAQETPHITNELKEGEYTFDTDFFLRDDELPTLPEGMQSTDTVAGLIIRPRAEGTWQRAN